MLNLFKRQQPSQTPLDFPTVDDLPMLSSQQAQEMLSTLRFLAELHFVKVCPPEMPGAEWRVWLDMTQQWITLTEWQQELLAATDGKEGA